MSVRRRQNWQGQQRVDSPHLKSVESAISNDFDELLNSFAIKENESYVVRGFKINMSGAVGSSANGLQLLVENSSFLHGRSDESGTFYTIPNGTPAEVLSSTTNERVEGAFTPSTDNYIGIEFIRTVDDDTLDQVYFWNATTDVEFTKTIPLAIILDYKITITTSAFPENSLPIAVVRTDSANNVIEIEDRRNLFNRLGKAGDGAPNPFYEYPWTEGKEENPSASSSSTISPFEGGDKQIESLKDLLDAIMTEIKLAKGTQYWYGESSGGSITKLRQDLANTAVSGNGTIFHDEATPGKVNWNSDIFLNFIGGKLKYRILKNETSTDVTLLDEQVAYIHLIRGIDITPNLIFTNGSAVVESVGSIAWTSDLQAGDYVKNKGEGDENYYQILSVDSASQVTLVDTFSEISSGPSGYDAQYAFGTYETNASPSTDRHVKIADRHEVPFDENHYWLYFRQDDGSSIAKVFVRINGGQELEQGEEQGIGDNTSEDILLYIGSAGEADNDPAYITLANGAKSGTTNYNTLNGENLTFRASQLTSMMADKAQDKTIIFAPVMDYVINTVNGSAQEITFVHDSGLPVLNLMMHSSAANGEIGLLGTLSLQENQAAYFEVDRNSAFSIADLSGLTIASVDAVPLGENVFVFAVREEGTSVYLWNGEELVEGKNLTNGAISDILNDNAYDEPLDVVSGVAANTNEIQGPVAPNSLITLPNDSRDGGASQGYVVGQGVLEVRLNGQELSLGDGFDEVGAAGSVSTTFQILFELEVEDQLQIRIDTAGGYFGIGSPGGGEANTGVNVGGEAEIFKNKTSTFLNFKTVKAGTNVIITEEVDTITINAASATGNVNITSKSTSETLGLNENVVLVDATVGDVTLTLPAAATATGKVYNIKKIDPSVNNVIIDADALETIDGVPSIQTNTQYESFTLVCNGGSWYII